MRPSDVAWIRDVECRVLLREQRARDYMDVDKVLVFGRRPTKYTREQRHRAGRESGMISISGCLPFELCGVGALCMD